MSKQPKLLNRHLFVFNPEDNGGESLTLMTEYFCHADALEIFLTQEITLNSYGSSATFNVPGFVTPATLRKLADELEKVNAEAIDIARTMIDKPH